MKMCKKTTPKKIIIHETLKEACICLSINVVFALTWGCHCSSGGAHWCRSGTLYGRVSTAWLH